MISLNPYIEDVKGGWMKEPGGIGSYVLGLDLGTSSVGWALVKLNGGNPVRLTRVGVHVFPAGVAGTDQDIERGKDLPPGQERRQARQQRRQTYRRAQRLRRVLRALKAHSLLPEGDIGNPTAIHEYFKQLDRVLINELAPLRYPPEYFPYELRVRALDERLSPHAFGRALYHLAQRRGFKSGRKDRSETKDDELTTVLASIKGLGDEITATGCRTLAEYLLEHGRHKRRTRGQWTSRQMYLDEFERLWSSQAKLGVLLEDPARTEIHKMIFSQRPLKSQAALIGRCGLEQGKRRAAIAARVAQEFRLLQKVLDLSVSDRDEPERPLTTAERGQLTAELRQRSHLTFKQIRDILELSARASFNLQRGGETRIVGHRTDAALAPVFGSRWVQLSEAERDRVVDEIIAIEDDEVLIKRAIRAWGLDRSQAVQLCEIELEPGYAAFSAKALSNLVEAMKGGLPFSTARTYLYPRRPIARVSRIPAVDKALPDLRNPMVTRVLTELRKVVNAIVGEFGPPERVRIELARDLKQPRAQRERRSLEIRKREKQRAELKARILRECGIQEPTRADIEKALLWDECNQQCPYTGRAISFTELFSAEGQWDIEHIWPRGRCLDDSFANKTLCRADLNRSRKKGNTPFEAFGDGPEWPEIIQRVRRFKGDVRETKLARFLAKELDPDLPQRLLNDTRYASRVAASYIGQLFGGEIDSDGVRRVSVTKGELTAMLRSSWGLNKLLGGQSNRKNRGDHRHHAVDAAVVALSSSSIVQLISTAVSRSDGVGRLPPIDPPWPDFPDELGASLERVNVSYRASRKTGGPLHADTLYGRTQAESDTKGSIRLVVRTPVESLSEAQMENIVDPSVRAAVQGRLAEIKGEGREWKAAMRDPDQHPFLIAKDGRKIPIHRVRVGKNAKPWTIGRTSRIRLVTAGTGTNHHTVILESKQQSGRGEQIVWKDQIVTRLEVHRRIRMGEPITQHPPTEDVRFLFTLAPNEMIEMDSKNGDDRGIFRVQKLSEGDIELCAQHDSRPFTDRKNAGERVRISAIDELRKRNAKKVRVTHLGAIVYVND